MCEPAIVPHTVRVRADFIRSAKSGANGTATPSSTMFAATIRGCRDLEPGA
jgi:hypothetical protein